MREVEKWVTFHGRRIPIFKKDEIKPLDKKELAKKIYKVADGTYMLDLPNGYSTSYGTNYIQAKTRKDVIYELDNFVSPDGKVQKTIKGFKRPEGNPELRIYGRDKKDNHSLHIQDDFYPDKKSAYQDTRANGYKGVRIFDKRDDYILRHTDDYSGMSAITDDYYKYKKWEKRDSKDGFKGAANLWKEKAAKLKEKIDKANKVYLQKQKKYKFKK